MANNYPSFIVIADDDQEDFEFFRIAIDEIPGEISLKRAIDGEALMAMLEVEVPDLLFLDLIMPRKDGKKCIQEIRANSKYDDLPVIIYSSLDHLPLIMSCFDEGATHYAVKPLTYTDMKALLVKILEKDWVSKKHVPQRSEFLLSV